MRVRSVIVVVALAGIGWGARELYRDVRFAMGVGTCADYASGVVSGTYVSLSDCVPAVHRAQRVEVPGAGALQVVPVTDRTTPDQPARLVLFAADDAVPTLADPFTGRVRRGSDAQRIAIAGAVDGLEHGWGVVEASRASRPFAAAVVLLLATATLFWRRRTFVSPGDAGAARSPGTVAEVAAGGAAGDVDAGASHSAEEPAPGDTAATGPECRVVDLDGLQGTIWLLRVMVGLLCILLPVVVLLLPPARAFSHRISGVAAARLSRAAWWSCAAALAAAALLWGLLQQPAPVLVLLWTAAWLVPAAVVFRAISRLNGYTEPALGLMDVRLLGSPGSGRPGLYASGRYLSVTLWLGITGVLWFVGAVLFGVLAIANRFSPIDLLRLLGTRTVRPLMSRASRASLRRRRYGSPAARALMSRDRRPPVLLLRSFVDDDLQGREESHWIRRADTFEEVLTEGIWALGPVVAIGQPGEPVPRAGAAREYVDHDGWQARVHQLARDAGVIVIVAGETPGIAWELANAARMGVIERTVLVFPPLDAAALRQRYRTLHRTCAAELGDRLPAALPASTLAVVFGADPPVALTAGDRSAAHYRLAIRIAARAAAAAGNSVVGRESRPLPPPVPAN